LPGRPGPGDQDRGRARHRHPARRHEGQRRQLRGARRLRRDARDGQLQPTGRALPRQRRRDHSLEMTDLRTALGEAVGAAFAEAGLASSFGRVTPSDRPDLADFQCNGALAAAKAAGRKPRDIADDVAARLAGDPRLASVELAGPGFINMKVSDAALSARAAEIAIDERAGAGLVDQARRVIIDYG